MSDTQTVFVPDIGDAKNVEVIEILVSPGDKIAEETPLITLESDKATMEVPSPFAGTVNAIGVAVGDKVSMGSPIAEIGVGGADSGTATDQENSGHGPKEKKPFADIQATDTATTDLPIADIQTEILVLGGGPGGYTAAFRAADLGKKTVLVERYLELGGVCLHVGCIPSKTYLHTAGLLEETRQMAERGVTFGEPALDISKMVAWKDRLTSRLAKGIAGLARKRNIKVLQGSGSFAGPNLLRVEGRDGPVSIAFEQAIIATGSRTVQVPGFPNDDPRLWHSSDALNPKIIPQRLLVIGGGIIGLEMAAFYNALGSRITVVELQDTLLPGCDEDLVAPLQKRITGQYENLFLSTSVIEIEARENGLLVSFSRPASGGDAPSSDTFDAVLVAIGRNPASDKIQADTAGIHVDRQGFISVDKKQRTNVPHIFAIGDVVGNPMLAHKATHQGKIAAEVAAGLPSEFDASAIPSVAYTDPEVAWMGLGEEEATAQGIPYDKGVFPWAASGRALGMGRGEGMTKLLFHKNTRRIIGAGIVGAHAGDLIAEAILALEMGADAEDLALTIHPHPTLSETLGLAAERVTGTITDLLPG